MMQPDLRFEWNAGKAAENLRKHGVSFEEATSVFDDNHAYTQDDELHSSDEPREFIIGYSKGNRLLIISFVQRGSNRIRIITARVVTRRERTIYEERTRF